MPMRIRRPYLNSFHLQTMRDFAGKIPHAIVSVLIIVGKLYSTLCNFLLIKIIHYVLLSNLESSNMYPILTRYCRFHASNAPVANKESSEVCGIIMPGRRVKLNRSQAVNVHKLLTIRYLLGTGWPTRIHEFMGRVNTVTNHVTI